MVSFAQLFAGAQASKGLTDEEAARTLGVSQPTVTRWRLGRNTPNDTLVPALARFIGVTERQLVKTLVPSEPRRARGPGTFGELIRQLELDRQFDAAEAWKRYGFDKSTYYRWRGDLSAPRLVEVPELAVRLRVPEEQIVLAIYRTELAKARR